MIIAIDGPAGSGKSTVAKRVAQELGFHYLDTGAMYRACALRSVNLGFNLEDGEELKSLAEGCTISFGYKEGEALPSTVHIDGQDVTREIRTPQIDAAVSPVSKHKTVRDAMTQQQRNIARKANYVVEGRDIGTVVFPEAEIKIFLTATAEERARRRAAQNLDRGMPGKYEDVFQAILARDKYDSERELSPLKPAEDSCVFDTTKYTEDEVVAEIIKRVESYKEGANEG